MSSRGHRIPNRKAPAEGSSRAAVGGPGNGERPRAFLGDTEGDVACGVWRETLQLGQRAVRFLCGQGRHVLHARCVVEALARGVAPALRCPAISCRAQHPRRDALEAAVQADPGLRKPGPAHGRGGRRRRRPKQPGAWYGWDHNSLGVRSPLDAVSSDDLQQHFATGKKYSHSWQEHTRA